LRVSDDAIFVPGRPFKARAIRAVWKQLASIDIGERWAVITTRAGRARKLDLQDLENADGIRAALVEAQRRLAAYVPERSAPRAFAFAFSPSRSRAGAVVTSASINRRAASATSSTARSNAVSFAFDGFVNPLIFRTNCRDAARTSSSVV